MVIGIVALDYGRVFVTSARSPRVLATYGRKVIDWRDAIPCKARRKVKIVAWNSSVGKEIFLRNLHLRRLVEFVNVVSVSC